jgi:transcriptional regulator with XRE-family HTH domain
MAVEVKVDEYDKFLKTLGGRIKELRKERGLSLRDMVLQHGYNDSQWRKYERGGSINLQSLLKVARVFGISLSRLLDGLGEYPEKTIAQIQKTEASERDGAPIKKATPKPRGASSKRSV